MPFPLLALLGLLLLFPLAVGIWNALLCPLPGLAACNSFCSLC